MGYQTVATGQDITATLWNANVRDQGVSVFASTAARDAAITSPSEGMICWTSDTDDLWVHSGSAWVPWRVGAASTWTPTLVQSGSVTVTVTRATIAQRGKRVDALCVLAVTGSGTSGQPIEVQSLPLAGVTAEAIGGTFSYFDAGSTIYTGVAGTGSTTSAVRFYVSGNGNAMGTNPTFAAASGDVLTAHISYETA